MWHKLCYMDSNREKQLQSVGMRFHSLRKFHLETESSLLLHSAHWFNRVIRTAGKSGHNKQMPQFYSETVPRWVTDTDKEPQAST